MQKNIMVVKDNYLCKYRKKIMYSLKNQYKSLLKEILHVKKAEFSGDGNVLIGHISDAANDLWSLKDGSGGRGEYSVAYDIISHSSNLQGITIEKSDLNIDKLMNKITIGIYSNSY